MILVVKHIENEGPGKIKYYLEKWGYLLKEIDLSRGDQLPVSLDGIQAVISLGGPMNVYEESKYQFLAAENEFINNVIEKKIAFLGICLGAQLLAKALGAAVKKAEAEEVGFFSIDLTENGKNSRLFKDMDDRLEVFQWHEDMFDIPDNSELLASSGLCRNQAFSHNGRFFGLQFHFEVDKDMISSWSEDFEEKGRSDERKKMLTEYNACSAILDSSVETLLWNFTTIMDS